MSEVMYPIAETFYSIQGEGTWAGTPMFFVRLAGCNVGRYAAPADYLEDLKSPAPFQLLHPEFATCKSFSGAEFICDTDYRVKERVSVKELAQRIVQSGAEHVCISGGEPFIHNLEPLVRELRFYTEIHIETSGTKPITLWGINVWITCSPKFSFLGENVGAINEFKFLVRDEADEKAVHNFVNTFYINDRQIWIQPIDESIDGLELQAAKQTHQQRQFAIDCVKRNPHWRLSIQAHKFLGVR